ncbi:MAG TPA: hypothetical protein VKB80_22750 [Kofleriaceae bacterium]|nr:hypothetical protein [Kofleriaceae bacterium]
MSLTTLRRGRASNIGPRARTVVDDFDKGGPHVQGAVNDNDNDNAHVDVDVRVDDDVSSWSMRPTAGAGRGSA